MRYVHCETESEANILLERVTKYCVENIWSSGSITSYGWPEQLNGKWYVEVLPGYENAFTEDELSSVVEFSIVVAVEEYKKEMQSRVQEIIDAKAQEYWFDSVIDATKTAIISEDENWKAQAVALLKYDDLLWRLVETHFNRLEAGNITCNVNDFLNSLPEFKL